MSYWTRRRPRQRTRAIDEQSIARATLAQLQHGSDTAITIRGVAAALGVAPASLYAHIGTVDDLLDLALDTALAYDADVQQAQAGDDLERVLLALHRHLIARPWTSRVIAARAPRGPAYLTFSERLCVLVSSESASPLAEAYALSNQVIGSALTATTSNDERAATVDADIAPTYAAFHASTSATHEDVLLLSIRAIRRGFRGDR